MASNFVRLLQADPTLLDSLTDRRPVAERIERRSATVLQMDDRRSNSRGRRVRDELQEKVDDAVRRDKVDHLLRKVQALGLWALCGIGGWAAVQVTLLYQAAPAISLHMATTTQVLQALQQASVAQGTELTRLDVSQDNLRQEMGRLQQQIEDAQRRLHEIERALARKGVM